LLNNIIPMGGITVFNDEPATKWRIIPLKNSQRGVPRPLQIKQVTRVRVKTLRKN